MTDGATQQISGEVPPGQPAGSINVGDVIDGKYLVGECIAWGGMGIVTEATHLHLQKAVALKCVRPEFLDNEEMVARFLNEARIAANLRNEHVARVLDFGKTEAGVPYLVMERLEGMSLAALVGERGQLPVSEAVDYLLQACEALAEAHAQGIVHRDIKPENLFVTQGVNGTPILKVLDFGISKHLTPHMGRRLTNPSSSMGSPCYMSPEQMRNAGLVDTRTDVWATGAVLFELLAAEPPFDGDSLPEICAHVMCDAPRSLMLLRPELPSGLAAVVARCLEKDRDNRFGDVAELARALEPYASADGRSSVPSIEHITSNSEPPPQSAARSQSTRDSSAHFAHTLLAPSTGVYEQLTSADVAVDAPITRIPGEHRRWPWLLAGLVVLTAASAGAARYLGYDLTFGHDVLQPLRGVLLPASLHDDVSDPLQGRHALDPQLPPKRGPGRAEREPDAPVLSGAEALPSAPAPPPRSWQHHASPAAELPREPPPRVVPDDPYIPAAP